MTLELVGQWASATEWRAGCLLEGSSLASNVMLVDHNVDHSYHVHDIKLHS